MEANLRILNQISCPLKNVTAITILLISYVLHQHDNLCSHFMNAGTGFRSVFGSRLIDESVPRPLNSSASMSTTSCSKRSSIAAVH
ncbi:hypothetical protein CEXT_218671 [Caerostris extrusa]|uniref:Uncharacterized protein n=1 Tax=Caerostris extrusa TaxID=172846 RepID=A0AAV4MJ54_CAEEX|nr:hypothetical protein CEXT_218671 [Caerostris extrusa]